MSDTEDCCAAIILALATDEQRPVKRKTKTTKERKKLSRPCTNGLLVAEHKLSSVADYKTYLRMSVDSFSELLEMVTPLIVKQDTVMREAISPERRLMATLRFLVAGVSFEHLKHPTGIASQTLCKIVPETCDAIVHALKGLIQIPASEDEWKDIAEQFERRCNFPHCIGAIDWKHILSRKPAGNYFSLVVMAVVNADHEFITVDLGPNRIVSNEGPFFRTQFHTRLINNELRLPQPDKLPNSKMEQPYVLVGDEAFPLLDNLMIPFSPDGMTKEQAIFNHRLSRPRRIAANALSILASRYSFLSSGICLNQENAILTVLACAHLHNFLKKKKDELYNEGGYEMEDTTTGNIKNADWHSGPSLDPLQHLRCFNVPESSEQVRLNFLDYFNSMEGAVPWQNIGYAKNTGHFNKR